MMRTFSLILLTSVAVFLIVNTIGAAMLGAWTFLYWDVPDLPETREVLLVERFLLLVSLIVGTLLVLSRGEGEADA